MNALKKSKFDFRCESLKSTIVRKFLPVTGITGKFQRFCYLHSLLNFFVKMSKNKYLKIKLSMDTKNEFFA